MILRGSYCEEHKVQRQKPCDYCGQRFIGSPDAKYCREECRWARRIKQEIVALTVLDWTQCFCGTWVAKRGRKYCSPRCRHRASTARKAETQIERKCKVCSVLIGFFGRKQFCKDCRADQKRFQRRKAKRFQSDKKRAEHYGVAYEPINRNKVYERDGWRCGLCYRKIDKRLNGNHQMSATLDHIIPVSLGGDHLYLNVQAAHRRCNSIKSNTGYGDQLALIG